MQEDINNESEKVLWMLKSYWLKYTEVKIQGNFTNHY